MAHFINIRFFISCCCYTLVSLLVAEGQSDSDSLFNRFFKPSIEIEEAPKPPPEPTALETYQVPSNALVIIDGGNVTGSGFIAKIKDLYFIVTNTHVIAPNKRNRFRTLNGVELTPQEPIFVSKDRDLAILRIETQSHYFEICETVHQTIHIGDWVVVPGNSQGAGVATRLEGRVQGIGPDRIEVDAKFVPGNSGSPIIDPRSGEVIGLASYAKVPRQNNQLEEDSPFSTTRRFAYRIDNNTEWQAVSQKDLFAQNAKLQQFIQRSEAFANIILNLRFKNILTKDYHNDPTFGYVLQRFDKAFNPDYGKTPGNIKAMDRLKHDLGSEMERDIPAMRDTLTIEHLRRQFEDYLDFRKWLQPHLRAISY